MSLIEKLFGAGAPTPPDATKLDGTTEATLAHSLSALSPDERGWITFAEARALFSVKGAEYAFGETDEDGKTKIESFAAQRRAIISFSRSRNGSISCTIGPQRISPLRPEADIVRHDPHVSFVP